MTEPQQSRTLMGSIPLYMKIGDGEILQIGGFMVPEGAQPPSNAEIAKLLHAIADVFARTPDGVKTPSTMIVSQ